MGESLFAEVRLFYAIEPSVDALESVLAQSTLLREGPFAAAALRWANPEGWHITSAFLGNVDVGLVPSLRRVLEALQPRPRKPDLVFGPVAAFPDAAGARVVVRSIGGSGVEALAHLEADLRARLIDLGILSETPLPYVPHLTLARVKNESIDLRTFEALSSSVRFEPVALTLFESRIEAGRRRYVPLASVAW